MGRQARYGRPFAVSNGYIPHLSEAPDAPPELARIVARSLAPLKEDRYPTALALQEDPRRTFVRSARS
jgi:hypothetical protein